MDIGMAIRSRVFTVCPRTRGHAQEPAAEPLTLESGRTLPAEPQLQAKIKKKKKKNSGRILAAE